MKKQLQKSDMIWMILIGLLALTITSCEPEPICISHGDWVDTPECDAAARADKTV